jgi:Predicted phosphohydrolases
MTTQFLNAKAVSGKSGRVLAFADTQYASANDPQQLRDMVSYVITRAPDLVIFGGDLIDDSTVTSQWLPVQDAVVRMVAAGLRVLPVVGNHDYRWATRLADRYTDVNTYLPMPSWLTGVYQAGHLENSWGTVVLGGRTWLVLTLEYGPRTAVVTWAQSVLAANPSLPVMLVTHAYLFGDGSRYDWPTYGVSQLGNPNDVAGGYGWTPTEGCNDGEALWSGLIYPSANVHLVISGHVALPTSTPINGRAHRTDAIVGGGICHQIVQNHQERVPNGDGWLSEYQFDEAAQSLSKRTYSPYEHVVLTGPADSFRLVMP